MHKRRKWTVLTFFISYMYFFRKWSFLRMDFKSTKSYKVHFGLSEFYYTLRLDVLPKQLYTLVCFNIKSVLNQKSNSNFSKPLNVRPVYLLPYNFFSAGAIFYLIGFYIIQIKHSNIYDLRIPFWISISLWLGSKTLNVGNKLHDQCCSNFRIYTDFLLFDVDLTEKIDRR